MCVYLVMESIIFCGISLQTWINWMNNYQIRNNVVFSTKCDFSSSVRFCMHMHAVIKWTHMVRHKPIIIIFRVLIVFCEVTAHWILFSIRLPILSFDVWIKGMWFSIRSLPPSAHTHFTIHDIHWLSRFDYYTYYFFLSTIRYEMP